MANEKPVLTRLISIVSHIGRPDCEPGKTIPSLSFCALQNQWDVKKGLLSYSNIRGRLGYLTIVKNLVTQNLPVAETRMDFYAAAKVTLAVPGNVAITVKCCRQMEMFT